MHTQFPRCALRSIMASSDATLKAGRVFVELDHARAKEGLARSALSRSELERLELERQGRALRGRVERLTAGLAGEQDHAR
jgi:hypothetical protein